jgi:hypothetical protein
MQLTAFKTKSLFDASTDLFMQFGITPNSNTSAPLPLAGILKDQLKDNTIFREVDKTYFIGLINDEIVEKGNELIEKKISFSDAEKKISSTYDGLMVFAVDLIAEHEPSRYEITELGRAFNRISKSLPVIVLVRYTDKSNNFYFSFVACERTKFVQKWRQGEKIGKVSFLKDINVDAPHPAHIKILKNLSIESIKAQNKKAIESFNELYITWQNLLNIASLNKAFYDEIIEWFNFAIEEIKLPGENNKSGKHKDFTIRLIARLIFIWFLKELKVVKDVLLIPKTQNGDSNNLIIPSNTGSAYYKFVLQNLFFNALNTKQKERKKYIKDFDVFASSFPDPDALKRHILECPHLNGGLFDENETDYITRKSANNAFVVPDDILIGDNGLNSLLSRYKFTIAENTPLDEELAVDPEMLGRIFENLLAEQSVDTQEAARKNAGAFYTPRPIVSYMCKNTLLRHLKIDITPKNGKEIVHKLLHETTVIDPACGSGAFPIGMLEEMMAILDIADPGGNICFGEMLKSKDAAFIEHISDFIADKQERYVKKLGLLRNCLFGIDLLDYAVEITKLRCWLSLIVEQRVDCSKDNYNLKPLPNLEFKFYKHNSLLRTFKGQNINTLIDAFDKKNLLEELVELENSYFISKSDKYGTKEEIKKKIVGLLEGAIDEQIKEKEHKQSLTSVNKLTGAGAKETEINKTKKKAKKIAEEIKELIGFKDSIKDYFIERVVFPGIFNAKLSNPGFDIVIGNPPYVNTKLINQMGMTDILKNEYGYCDDLYNHFTVRAMELLKQGGYLSYITSDTFLTIQSKENMRRLFLGLHKTIYCRLLEIINTPKAFAAMVDTAIFTVQKQAPETQDEVTYIDIRFPNADTFGITEKEWKAIKESKNSVAGWEKVLNKIMQEVQLPVSRSDEHQPIWKTAHSCNASAVLRDNYTKIEKYKLPLNIYNNSLNHSLFVPNVWNCKVYDMIVKPTFRVFEKWWTKIETSKKIDAHENEIKNYLSTLRPSDITILGLVCNGAHGLTTGDNGRFVGAIIKSKAAQRIIETRHIKLKEAVDENPSIRTDFKILKGCIELSDYAELLGGMKESEIRALFDEMKDKYGARVFGMGYLYRIIDTHELYDLTKITLSEKKEGINTKLEEVYVPYDKGDKDGHKWYTETQFRINWSKKGIVAMKKLPGNRWDGSNFFFLPGFSWNLINGTRNSNDFKVKLISPCVNDVGGMKLCTYQELEGVISDKFIVCLFNSKTINRLTESFINFTLNFQLNDAKQIPIKIPTKEQLNKFDEKFDACYKIKKDEFGGKYTESEAQALLQPLEKEIDRMVEELYGLN